MSLSDPTPAGRSASGGSSGSASGGVLEEWLNAAIPGGVRSLEALLIAARSASNAAAAGLTPFGPVSKGSSGEAEAWCRAVMSGDAGWVKRLVEAGGHTPETSRSARAALLLSAALGQAGCVKALLDAGAVQVDHKDSNGRTALFWAACSNSVATLQVLVRAGADVNCADNEHVPPLAIPACNGLCSAVEVLLANGADVDACTTTHGRTVLWQAANAGQVECVVLLLKAGANAHVTDEHGHTALIAAATNGDVKTVDVLLAHSKANLHARSDGEMTALMWAAANGKRLCVRALLAAGADLNATNASGKTALMLAAVMNEAGTVRELVCAGADTQLKSNAGQTAMQLAAQGRYADCVRALLEAADPSRAALEVLLCQSLDVLRRCSLVTTPEDEAAWRSWVTSAIAAVLLDAPSSTLASHPPALCAIEVQWRHVLERRPFSHAWRGGAAESSSPAIQIIVSQQWKRVVRLKFPLLTDTDNLFGGRDVEEVAGGMRTACSTPEAGEFAGRTSACNCCGAEGVKLRGCDRCRAAFYCSRDCQREHWRAHKPTCRALAP